MTRHSRERGNPAFALIAEGSGTPAFAGVTVRIRWPYAISTANRVLP
jgi:hypothetical protein